EAGGFVVTSMAGFGLGTTSENLQGAIDGETFEITEMYPAYMDVARMQEEKGAVRSFNYAVTAEKIHAAMFTSAKQSADEGKDIDLGPVQICLVCGHTREGDAPEKCPVCSSPKEKFQAFA
ncbi:MAG: rubrerythrin family protein, partial [Phycisphaerae bacterium]|nr:rubrerythrin family protein [Phycisphaerae bacterium]